MATASLTSTPTTLDAGTSSSISIRNTGTARVTIVNGSTTTFLRRNTEYNEPVLGAVTAAVPAELGGAGTITWSAGGSRSDVVTYDELTVAVAASIAAQATTDSGTYAGLIHASRHAAGGADDLSPYFTRIGLGIIGNRTVGLGDSITLGSDSGSGDQNWGDGWLTYASLLSGGKIRKVRNAGVTGNTSAQMLARFDTDVTPYAPTVVTLLCGTNDVGNGVALATTTANIRAIVAKIFAIGALPVLCTIPPNGTGSPANRQRDGARLNHWISRYAQANGLPLVDFYSLLVDYSTGGYLSSYDSGDHTHPNAAGYAAMGALVNTVLGNALRPWVPPLVAYNADTDGGPTNGMFLTDSNADGIPNNWTGTGGGASFTHTIVTDANVVGSMAKIQQNANGSIRYLYSGGIPVTPAAGDVIGFGCVVTTDGGVSVNMKIEYFTAGSASITSVTHTITQAVTRGVLWTEVTCPANTGIIAISLIAGAGSGNVQWGRVTARNLTQSGIAAA